MDIFLAICTWYIERMENTRGKCHTSVLELYCKLYEMKMLAGNVFLRNYNRKVLVYECFVRP